MRMGTRCAVRSNRGRRSAVSGRRGRWGGGALLVQQRLVWPTACHFDRSFQISASGPAHLGVCGRALLFVKTSFVWGPGWTHLVVVAALPEGLGLDVKFTKISSDANPTNAQTDGAMPGDASPPSNADTRQ
jgi:hypothetical protein